jgi:hypothetical protein
MNTKQRTTRQHYVPRSYLARFTNDGSDEGCLQVRDIATSGHRESTPARVAMERNLYTLEGSPDPMALEDGLAAIESRASQQIATIEATLRLPHTDAGMSELVAWIAVQSQRVPQTIKAWNEYYGDIAHMLMEVMSENKARYNLAMAGVEQAIGAARDGRPEYHDFRAALANTSFQVDRNTLMRNMVERADILAELLKRRSWTLLIAPRATPDFITGDTPVSLVPTERISRAVRNWPLGFGMPGTIVFYPLTPRLAMLGALSPGGPLPPTVKELAAHMIAEVNSATISASQRWIFSRRRRIYRAARLLARSTRLPMPPVDEELAPANGRAHFQGAESLRGAEQVHAAPAASFAKVPPGSRVRGIRSHAQ